MCVVPDPTWKSQKIERKTRSDRLIETEKNKDRKGVKFLVKAITPFAGTAGK